ncbi:unnamed protein product [Urochloa decumbens]|uniref:Cytochrome P450 n=1 Tax=Urochloa decumbens TaxID=240449 RepID=A0ABC9GH84_9POAL
MEEGSFLHVTSPLVLSVTTLIIAVLCNNLVRHLNNESKWPLISNKESVLRRLGIRLGDIPTTVILDSAVAVDALVRRADAFSDRPAGGGATTIISNGRLQIITTVPYGPHWVALRRNLSSEAFHPVRGLARAAPHRARALSALAADLAARSASAVPVRECLYTALFTLNAATCFGDGVVDGERVEAMRAAQQEFLRILPSFRVFSTFQKVAKLLYRDRWNQLVHCRRRQEELYLPLIRARQEWRRTRAKTAAAAATSYVDTLLDLEVPDGGNPPHGRRKLNDGEMVGLVSEYLGAATGTVLAVLEWTLANLVLRPDVQSRLRGEVEAAAGAGGEASCAYLRAVVMESLRQHPPVPSVQRHMSRDVVVGSTPVARGTLVNFSLEEVGRDGKIWMSPKEFIPDRFMPGGEGEDVRLTIGTKEATKVMMMPFGAGRRICPGMGYAILHIEYFLANLITAFEWHPFEGEEVNLKADHGFFTTMFHPLQARVVPRVRRQP